MRTETIISGCDRLTADHDCWQNLGEKLNDDEIEGLLDEADEEGVISYSEFCSIQNL